jgi:hypothetical protein
MYSEVLHYDSLHLAEHTAEANTSKTACLLLAVCQTRHLCAVVRIRRLVRAGHNITQTQCVVSVQLELGAVLIAAGHKA